METSPPHSYHIRDQGEHGIDIKGEKGCICCNHTARIWALPAEAAWATGEVGDVLNHSFLAPCGCRLDASRNVLFPTSSAGTTQFNCITNPWTWEKHTVSILTLLPAQTELEHRAKPWDSNHQGKGWCDICIAAPELQREPGPRKSEIQSHSAFQEQLCLCHQHELWLMISYAY